jgi:hypothetical protein
MNYEYEFSLRNRCARSVREANAGMATMLRIEESERAEAVRLIGAAPCIIATHDQAMSFLRNTWMPEFFAETKTAKRARIKR